jgi:hypothetical protein
LLSALEDALGYLNKGGEIAIIDGTNTTLDRRDMIRTRVSKEDGFGILWIENKFGHTEIVTRQLDSSDLKNSPDYQTLEDFEARLKYYREHYETLSDDEGGSFIKVHDSHFCVCSYII